MAEKDYTELLINWLKSAHSLESTLANVLENQAQRASSFPELQSRLHGHREESLRHGNMVETCITELGGEVSEVRTQISKLFGETQSKMLGAYKDTVVRDIIIGISSEQMEIASYKAIITLARQLGRGKIADRCEQILEDELKMHDYLDDNLEDVVTRSYEMDLLTK